MSFTPAEPHFTVAVVMGQAFFQFSDPLDWAAERMGFHVKVDRTELMESLALRRGVHSTSGRPEGEARGSDKTTRFRVELLGRVEGKLVGLCSVTFAPAEIDLEELEERATELVALNKTLVLGVQGTLGKQKDSEEGVAEESSLIRLLPMNVLNRLFFQSKIEQIEKNRKVEIYDADDAAIVRLTRPWLFLDIPSGRKKSKKPAGLLPFS